MLVLTRKFGGKVFIGDDLCITVVGIERGKVRLGIEAPKSVPIFREEIAPSEQAKRWKGAAGG